MFLFLCVVLGLTGIGVLPAGAQPTGQLLPNGTFEGGSGNDGRGGGVPEWLPYGQGYTVDRQMHRGGDQSIRCDSLNPNVVHGAQTTILLNQSHPVPVTISGWSRADQVSEGSGSDYSIGVEAEYRDGTRTTQFFAPFRAGTHGWQRRQVSVAPSKPLHTLTIIARFQYRTGTAWFDDFTANPLSGAGIFDAQPLQFPAGSAGKPVVHLAGRDGLALDFDARGGVAAVRSGTQKVSEGTGGFYLRDVAAEGPLIPIRGEVHPRKAGGINLGGVVNRLHVVFNAAVYAERDSLTIDGELTDTTRSDRAVSVYLALPVNAEGWLWGDDIRHARRIEGAQEFTNQTSVSVGATGSLSLYPYATVANASGGLAIASQMEWPSVYRLFYNGAVRQFVIAWDFALTGKTAAWPSHNARFRCRLFRLPAGPTEWAFRQATQRFYAQNAPNFQRRTRMAGTWLPFTDPTRIASPTDFGFAFHQGDNSLKADDMAGLLSFRPVQPQVVSVPMPSDAPPTYETALALLQRLAGKPEKKEDDRTENKKTENKNGKPEASSLLASPSSRENARAVLNSGSQQEDGRFNVAFVSRPSETNAVFIVNPNPELPATPDKPSRASTLYTVARAIQMYGPQAKSERGEQDGECLDALEAWSDVEDYRASNLGATPYPLPFDTDSRKPCLPQWFSTHTFARYLRDDLHNRNRLLMASFATPIRFAIYAPLLDILGFDADWLTPEGQWQPDNDALFNLRRTLSGPKPCLMRLNSDPALATSGQLDACFQRCLFYGVFPTFSGGAYWETPALYNRDRPLFCKYVPLLKRMASEGWELLPYAHTDRADVYVERWGRRLFTLLNDGTQSQHTTLTIEAQALNANAASSVMNVLTGASLPVQRAGGELRVTLPLGPAEAALLELR